MAFEDIEDLKNIGVWRKQGHEFGFVLEALTVGGISEKAFVDDFAGIEIVGDRVEATEDGAESSMTDFFAQLVVVLQGFAHSVSLECCWLWRLLCTYCGL